MSKISLNTKIAAVASLLLTELLVMAALLVPTFVEEQARSGLYASLYDTRRLLLVLLVLTVFLTFTIIWLAVSSITRPLRRLANHMQVIGEGTESDTELEIASGDELGKLFTAFNGMMAEMNRRHMALKEQLLFSQTLMDTIPNPVYYKDASGHYLGCNKAFETATGAHRDEIIGKNAYDLFVKELADIYCNADAELLANKGEQVFENKAPYSDGTLREVIFYKATFDRLDGELGGLVGIYLDISERKAVEDELRKLHYAVNQCPVSIVITDVAGRIEYVNPRFSALTGYSLEEAIGRNPAMLKSGETPVAIYEGLWQTLLAGQEWRGTFHNRKKNGELYREEALIGPIRDNQGRITHFIALKEDVTEKVGLELQLRHAQKMESIGRLAGGLAHDFNNMLTAIVGYVSILEMHLQGQPALTGYLGQINQVVERAASLTKGLLAFGRLQKTNPTRLELNDVVCRVQKLLTRLIGEDIHLQTELAALLLPIMADSTQIEQVIMNLVTNARDALPRGGNLKITTGLTNLDQEFIRVQGFGIIGEYALLSVSDSGAGMDSTDVRKIFEPFYTTKEVGKGSGLGLSVVYGIIKEHKGYIICASEPDHGTEFRIYLPLAEGKTAATPQQTPTLPDLHTHGEETILLAEDEPAVRQMVKSLLEECGYTVIAAGDGAEAVALFTEQSRKIKLVILDSVMPFKSGQEVFTEMRTLVPEIKCIFTSGYPQEVLVGQGMLDQSAKSLCKPVAPAEMLRTIREVLDS